MPPLGVAGHLVTGTTLDPFKDPSIWRRPKSPKWKRVQYLEEPQSRGAASLLPQANNEGCQQPANTICSPRTPPRSIDPFTVTRPRPKHVPIIVPRYVPLVAPDSPCYSAEPSPSKTPTSTLSSCPSIADFSSAGRKPSTDSGRHKRRHVEIVIPAWAQPVQTLPDSPVSLPGTNTDSNLRLPLPAPRLSPPRMTRHTPNTSRSNTLDSSTSAPSPAQLYSGQFRSGSGAQISSLNSSQSSLHRPNTADDREPVVAATRTPGLGVASAGPSPATLQTAGTGTPSNSNSSLSGLVCNVYRTTGQEPRPLVGATTTILGDKLYVYGGRRLSRTRPQLTTDLYELDLIRRHWTKIEARGDIPPPRYFHSVCPLGDTKLVCYGGMSPAILPSGQPTLSQQQTNPQDLQPEVVVMSDIHIFDVPSRTWTKIPTSDSPQGRYAHCAAILPSSAVFSSANAPLSAIHHNPSSSKPNQGSIGVSLDGTGGAEMVVVGGQDSANHYIEQVSVFNLRSLKWTATNTLGRSCGAYRSVVCPISTLNASSIGAGTRMSSATQYDGQENQHRNSDGSAMLIYSNYNFLDVKLELQIRLPDGTLVEKPMQGSFSPPGLRFPNGGVMASSFIVSGTFLTSSKQEYALWALDLRKLTWSKIDAGGNIFTQGSWNRGVLWHRRNTFVILGNRKRSLVEDYNHRRINFSNLCMVELEAFGLYDNPRRTSPMSDYISVSSPSREISSEPSSGGRQLSQAAKKLGHMALEFSELADMDFLAIGGERIPINSHLIARRWGPYFNQLLREVFTTQENNDTATLRPGALGHPSRNSSITITPSIKTTYSATTTLTVNNSISSTTTLNQASTSTSNTPFGPPDARSPNPSSRPRTLYLPHTHLTIQALVHYLYTSSLPPPHNPLCTPQILCSLLQIARPYRIDGLLEAIIDRLHVLLDGRNTAAIFNAAAMAAGGGDGVAFLTGTGATIGPADMSIAPLGVPALAHSSHAGPIAGGIRSLRINTDVGLGRRGPTEDGARSATSTTSTSASEVSSRSGVGADGEVWHGEVSAVIGLQKRGLRGLMEGRRMREMGRGEGSVGGVGDVKVGLGIA